MHVPSYSNHGYYDFGGLLWPTWPWVDPTPALSQERELLRGISALSLPAQGAGPTPCFLGELLEICMFFLDPALQFICEPKAARGTAGRL